MILPKKWMYHKGHLLYCPFSFFLGRRYKKRRGINVVVRKVAVLNSPIHIVLIYRKDNYHDSILIINYL